MPLSELGAFLQRHREEQELSIEEASELTRIRPVYIQAMESGEWDALPDGVYIRGLLKNYARMLGLSTDSIMRMYVKERPKEARLPEPQLISQPLVNEPRVTRELMIALVAISAAIFLIGWMFINMVQPRLEEARQQARATANPAEQSETSTPEPTQSSGRSMEVAPIEGDDSSSAGTAGPTARPSRTPRPTSSPSPTPPDGIEIMVKAENNVWLRVNADGNVVFEGMLRKGENETWQGKAERELRIRTGNAGETEILLNGRRLDALGETGDVREAGWRLLDNGDIEQLP